MSSPESFEPIFTDRSHQPTDADLAATLGRAHRQWHALVRHVAETCPKAEAGWKHYSGTSGWQWVARLSGRNLIYLKPLGGRVLAALALNDDAVAAADEAGLPDELLETIKSSPRQREGRAARVLVITSKDAEFVRKLLALKTRTTSR